MKGVSDVRDQSGVMLCFMQMTRKPHHRMVLIFRQISVVLFEKGGKTNQNTTIAKRMTNVYLASKEERRFFVFVLFFSMEIQLY